MSSSLRSFYLLHNNCQIPLDLESVDAGESADEDIGVMTCWLKNSAKVSLMNDGVAFLSESAECGKMSALLAFGLVAADVEGERSLHVLLPYDQAMFAYAASLPTDAILYARTVVSDTPIEAALYAWAGALAVGTLRPGARRRVWEASFFAFVGALVLMGPPPLGIVSFLKDAFERPRPEAVLSSYAFPSGHTAAACYGWGVLFLSLLPSAVPESLRLLRTPDGDAPSPTAFALWSLPVVCTAGGRVVGEAHWLSDTIAGACVAASTALLASGAARWAKQTRERAQ